MHHCLPQMRVGWVEYILIPLAWVASLQWKYGYRHSSTQIDLVRDMQRYIQAVTIKDLQFLL